MATKAKRLVRGRPGHATYNKMAEKAKSLEPGKYFTAARCDNDAEAHKMRDKISAAVRLRVTMPKGLRLSFCRTEAHTVQIWCEEV